MGRNTAPAIALSAFKALEHNSDAILVVLAADHVIEDKETFQKSVELAAEYAEQGKIVTFGIVPSTPETGFGYIQGEKSDKSALKIKQCCYMKTIKIKLREWIRL